jgi:crotonobetainyl-CoA:carnitine CoA-transferase CaiB-like acyl-CoA transferase
VTDLVVRQPLSGIRVVELGELIAGPFVGTMLAEAGAEVIKIERPGSGDVLRQFGPMVNGSSVFWQVNSRNKKSVVLNLAMSEGLGVLRDLLARSDLVIISLRPGVLDKMGLDDKALRELNARLLIVHVSAFGHTGPYSDRGGYDPVAQGFSGLSFLTGHRDGSPMRAGGAVPICDFMTGLLGAFGALTALYNRDCRAEGPAEVVDVALYDVALRMIGPLLTYFDVTGQAWQRDGNHSLGGAPTGHFAAGDGRWVCLSVQNDMQFARCASVVGRPDWSSDPRFLTLSGRTENRDEIESVVADWIAARGRDDVIEQFQAKGLGIGPIHSIDDLAKDVHANVRGLHWVDDPVLGTVRFPTPVPIRPVAGPTDGSPAPHLGQDTNCVLTSILGYSDATLALLTDRKVIPAVGVSDVRTT